MGITYDVLYKQNKVVFKVTPKGLPGLSAFNQWKKEENLPNATWDDYMLANKGDTGNVGVMLTEVVDGVLYLETDDESTVGMELEDGVLFLTISN